MNGKRTIEYIGLFTFFELLGYCLCNSIPKGSIFYGTTSSCPLEHPLHPTTVEYGKVASCHFYSASFHTSILKSEH